ncbi:MAG: carboxymuconolactone decarboxylase family protein [Betaproteobacteria bacterium]|nr:carboxymuconolactone decarboxylase family protein [Betaproteobacteria bacterium]
MALREVDIGEMRERLHEVESLTQQLKEKYPAEINAFLNFMQKAEAGPALSVKQKELINVALSVAAQCGWCIALHVRHAADAGAGRDEVVEAAFMAVLMHGGPALMYLTPLWRALEEFLPEAKSQPPHP